MQTRYLSGGIQALVPVKAAGVFPYPTFAVADIFAGCFAALAGKRANDAGERVITRRSHAQRA